MPHPPGSERIRTLSASPPTRPEASYPEPSWWGWGDASQVPVLPDSILSLLREGLGVERSPGDPGPLDTVALAPSRLSAEDTEALVAILGPSAVLSDDEARVRHTRGKSTPDLLRLRAGDAAAAPDLVLLAPSHDEVLQILRVCSERRIAVVPFGGGTSVVGGLEPSASGFSGVVALDVRRMNALLELDEESRVARFQPGLRAPEAERLLESRGYTLGHFPQSFEYATLGGFAAARSSGQASAGYGRFDDLVVGLRLAAPTGELALGRAPKSAAGPDLRQLVLGSEGAFGVITELSLALRPVPEARVYEGWRFASFADGLTVLRRLAQDGPRPTVLRLSDETETALNLARPGEIGESSGAGALAIVGFEGEPREVEARRADAARVLEAGGAAVEPDAGETWERERYRGPYLRDALLSAGALVETLETVTFWSSVPRLYEAVSEALRESLSAAGSPPVILCHVSHVYPAGASLYFTVACAQAAEDPIGQWQAAKAAAGDAILQAGGSITHHHGVGRDHLPWYAREIGSLGVSILRAVKAELDPSGIMNPGVLVPLRYRDPERCRSG